MISLKNNNFLQACIPLALVLTFFCTPVFSLSSVVDSDKFDVSFSALFANNSNYLASLCFDGLSTTCASDPSGTLKIQFFQPTNVSKLSFTFVDSRTYDYFEVNGSVRYYFNSIFDSFDLLNVSDIVIYPPSGVSLYFSEVSFDFESFSVIGGTGGGTGADIVDDFRCKGFSCWFLTEEAYRDVWLALMTFMVSIFSLAYLGKIIRTGGQS